MVTNQCRYRNHATHQVHFHSQQNESQCIFLLVNLGVTSISQRLLPFLAVFLYSARLQLLNFVNKTFWWSRFSFCTSHHPEVWSHRASAKVPPPCKSHQYPMSYFVGDDFDMCCPPFQRIGLKRDYYRNMQTVFSEAHETVVAVQKRV